MLRIWAMLPCKFLICPASPPQSIQPLGVPSCGWLNRLNTSTRNWVLTRSVIGIRFATEKSTLAYRGPYSEFRLPNVSGAGRRYPFPPLAANTVALDTGVKNCRNGLPLLGVCRSPTLIFVLPTLLAQQGPESMSAPHSP